MIIAVDIDGVIANPMQRAGNVIGDSLDAFYDQISNDEPIREGVGLVRCLIDNTILRRGTVIVLVSARHERTRSVTTKWLERYLGTGTFWDNVMVRLRPENNNDKDVDFKMNLYRGLRPDLVIEDDGEIVNMLYKEGFPVMHFLWSKEFEESRDKIKKLIDEKEGRNAIA